MLAADCVTVKLPSGTSIVLASPSEPARGPISTVLAERGESMFAVTFAVDWLAEVVVDAARAWRRRACPRARRRARRRTTQPEKHARRAHRTGRQLTSPRSTAGAEATTTVRI